MKGYRMFNEFFRRTYRNRYAFGLPSYYQGLRTRSDLDGLTVPLNLYPIRTTRHLDCLTMPAASSLPTALHVPVSRLALASCGPRASGGIEPVRLKRPEAKEFV